MLPKTCWMTGAVLPKPSAQPVTKGVTIQLADDSPSKEHLLPRSSAVFRLLTREQLIRNVVPEYRYANKKLAGAHLPLKFKIRDRIWTTLYGTTEDVPMDARTEWSDDLRDLITREINDEMKRYHLVGQWVWHNPFVRNTSFWSPGRFPPAIIELRRELVNELKADTTQCLERMFGTSFATEELQQAIALDFNRTENVVLR